MKAFAAKQRGISFLGFLTLAVGVIFVAILGMKVVPAYVHNAQLGQVFKSIAADPAMQNASIKEIKESFSKRASVNYISDVNADDIEITRADGRLILSSNYSVKIPLVGNITLLLEFNPSSS